MKNKWFINLFLGFTKLTGILPALLFFKPKVYRANGCKRLPKPCIIVSNHKSLLDFVLYLVIFPFRTIHFLMAEVLYNKSKFFAFLLNSWGGIKVERDDRDFSFVADTLEVLDNKGCVGIFPEGRLPVNNKPWPFTTSTAFIAMRTDAPCVPVYTFGNYSLFRRAKVCIGEPIYVREHIDDSLSPQEQLEAATKLLEEKVYELKSLAEKEKKPTHPLFSFKYIPMDMARLVCSVLVPILRIKKRTPEGEKYTERIKGGAIIAANHTSFADPFVVGVSMWYRRLYFLVAEVVMKGKLRPILLKGVGAIEIDRNATDIEAINKSVQKLKEGFLLTVFPQGEIHRADDIDAIKSGAVLMAIRAGVPIIPMHILPRKKWYNMRTVVIGNTIDPKQFCAKKFPSTLDIKNISDALIEELCRCKSANDNFNI